MYTFSFQSTSKIRNRLYLQGKDNRLAVYLYCCPRAMSTLLLTVIDQRMLDHLDIPENIILVHYIDDIMLSKHSE